MAVHPSPHNEAWKVVSPTGEIWATHNNGRDAIQGARLLNCSGYGLVQAVRA